MLTLQQAFDRALYGIRKQGAPATRRTSYGGDTCVYYDETTERRCGVGQVLTRAQATDLQDELDSSGVRGLAQGATRPEVWPLLLECGVPDNPRFVDDLQLAHDAATVTTLHEVFSAEAFEASMRTIAKRYGLKYTAR